MPGRTQRADDLTQFLIELTNLSRRFGLILREGDRSGIHIDDQEHRAVIARRVTFDDRKGAYRGVTTKPYLEGDEPT